jgi:hypothetical protein
MSTEDITDTADEEDIFGRGYLHSFDSEMARVHGLNAAIVYQHVEWLSKRCHGFVKRTVNQIAENYSYLTFEQVRLALKALKKGGPLVRKRAKYGGATTYELNPDYALGEGKRIKFLVSVAARHGVVAALVYDNLEYWIRDNWERKAQDLLDEFDIGPWLGREELVLQEIGSHSRYAARCKQPVKGWADLHPYVCLRTAERAFARLENKGMLKKRRSPDRIPIWSLPAKILDEIAPNILGLNMMKNAAAKTHVSPPKHMSRRQNTCLAAKTHVESGLSDCAAADCDAVDEDSINEDWLSKKVARKDNAFASASVLANARPESARTALNLRLAISTIRRVLAELDVSSPNRIVKKPRAEESEFGWSTKRKYTKKIVQDDDGGFGDLNE